MHLDDITIAKPTAETTTEAAYQWLPYASSASSGGKPSVLGRFGEVCRQQILMAEIMAPVANTV